MKYIYVIGCVSITYSESFSFPTLGAYTSESAAQKRMDELKCSRIEEGAKVYWDTPIEWSHNGREIRSIYMGFSFDGAGWTKREHLYLIKYKV